MKTAWEKIQDGEIYNDFDSDLFNRRAEAITSDDKVGYLPDFL